MPAGKTHFRDTGSDFCCLWLAVMEGVAKSHTLDARGTPRRVIVPSLSSHACRRYMRCTCRKDVSVDQKLGHLLPLVGPQHRPWPLGQATIAGATAPPCGIHLRHVNLENKFLVSTMVPNHACRRNEHQVDQQSVMETRKVCGARREGLWGRTMPCVFWLFARILIAGTSRPGHSINCLSTPAS